MEVYLYQHHRHLPARGGGGTAFELFDRDSIAGRIIEHGHEKTRAEETFLWQILVGLENIELPFLAHVSAFHRFDEKLGFGIAYRNWVQITTSPQSFQSEDSQEVNLLGKNAHLVCLYGHDNGTRTPYELIPSDKRDLVKMRDPVFWTQFFTTELMDCFRKALAEKNRAAQKADRYMDLLRLL